MAVQTTAHFRRVDSLINDLYARSFAGIAAISTVHARIEDESLGQVIETYMDVSKTQVQRLHDLAASTETDLQPASDVGAIDDVRHAVRDLAQGLLAGKAEAGALKAMERLSTAKLELYREGGGRLNAGAGVQAVMLAGEAEEAGFLDRLQHFHVETEISGFDTANAVSFAF